MAEFGKRGFALKPTVAPPRKASGTRPRLGGGLFAVLLASLFAWFGASLAETMHTFFSGIFVVTSVLFGFGVGESLRSLRFRFAAGNIGLGALCVVETLVCAALFGRYLVMLYNLEMSVRLGNLVVFLLIAAPGFALTLYMQTGYYERKLRARTEGGPGSEG